MRQEEDIKNINKELIQLFRREYIVLGGSFFYGEQTRFSDDFGSDLDYYVVFRGMRNFQEFRKNNDKITHVRNLKTMNKNLALHFLPLITLKIGLYQLHGEIIHNYDGQLAKYLRRGDFNRETMLNSLKKSYYYLILCKLADNQAEKNYYYAKLCVRAYQAFLIATNPKPSPQENLFSANNLLGRLQADAIQEGFKKSIQKGLLLKLESKSIEVRDEDLARLKKILDVTKCLFFNLYSWRAHLLYISQFFHVRQPSVLFKNINKILLTSSERLAEYVMNNQRDKTQLLDAYRQIEKMVGKKSANEDLLNYCLSEINKRLTVMYII